jgi:hypothetical protein
VLGDLEPDRAAGLALLAGCPLNCISMRSDALDAEPHQVACAQLAVQRQIEEGWVALPTVKLEARAYCPDVLWLERWFNANELAFVPSGLRAACCSGVLRF